MILFLTGSDKYTHKMAAHERGKGCVYCVDHLKEEITFFCTTCGIPLCNDCVASKQHKSHDLESIKNYAKMKYTVLQDFKTEARNQRIPDIKEKANVADKDYNEFEQEIQSRIKNIEDHGEHLKELIGVQVSRYTTTYKNILARNKKGYVQYKSETGDALQSLDILLKESTDAITSNSNHLIVDVANGVEHEIALKKFPFSNYKKPNVPDFNCGSSPEKHIQAVFGNCDETKEISTVSRGLMAIPEMQMTKQEISNMYYPTSIERNTDNTVFICTGTSILILLEAGSLNELNCDVKVRDVAMHPSKDHIYCIHYERKDVRSLNRTGETKYICDIEEVPSAIAVTQDDKIIIGQDVPDLLYVYTTAGVKLQTMAIKCIPRHITICVSTGKIAIACGVWGVIVLDDQFNELYTTRPGRIWDVHFDDDGYLLAGNDEGKCVYVLNAETGECVTTIPPELLQSRVQCLTTQTNGDLLACTHTSKESSSLNPLVSIKYIK